MEGFVLLVQPYYLLIFSSAYSSPSRGTKVETKGKFFSRSFFPNDDLYRAYFDTEEEEIASVDPDW
jgi:hypothetical protein